MNAHNTRQLSTKLTIFIGFFVVIAVLASCSEETATKDQDNTVVVTYTFSADTEGWLTDFADYPVGEEDFYELSGGHAMLPPPLDETDGALRLSGSNRSDDLFMFAKKKLDGLLPNTTYNITFDMDIAVDEPSDLIVIGGGGLSLKIGATAIEPRKITSSEDQTFYVMNIDKGNQIESGEDMIRIGEVYNDTEFEYSLINRDNTQTLFEAQTNDAGELWLVVGTDSGFEGITNIYYTKIAVRLESK